GSASPPLALMPPATSSSSSARRATSTVFAPSAANSSAMPRPMPLLAPVTIAILPWSCPAILSSRSRKCHYSRKACYGHNRLFGCATGRRAWSRLSSFATMSLYPRKQTSPSAACMSAKCQKRTHAPRVELRLLVPQLTDPIALFPFSSSDSLDHFERHFEESVPVFAPACFA